MESARSDELARLRPKLMAYALRRTRGRDQAEDAVQEALLAALEGLDGYAGGASLSTWLFGILKHKIVDGLRRGSREQPLEQDVDTLMHAGPGPEQSCASRTALLLLERSLGRLPPKSADAFVLCEVLGMDTPEACRALGVTPSHCWVLVHRARQRLRACPQVGQVAAEAG
jgi:RNA polymerase sigma-70 factor (ECF subfamily)